MDSKIEFNELCRLCLARKNVNIHIFEGEGCKEGIFLKISTCLPVNISLEDKLPKRICSNCFGKLNILYQFYNKSVNSEKQLLEWYNECATENDNETFTDNIDIEMTQDDSEVEVKEEELPFLPEENVNYNIKLEEVNVQDISHQVNEMSHEECSDTIGSNAVTNGEVDTLKSEDDEDGSSVTSNPLRTEINSRYTKVTNDATLDLLPKLSRAKYEKEYTRFKDWCEKKNIKKSTETALLAYMSELAQKYKASSLWAKFSMVKAVLGVKENVDASRFSKVVAFLKRKGDGYETKKSKTFTREDLDKFILQAPDRDFLMFKVVAIMGVGGACRKQELLNLSVDNIKDTGSAITVKVPDAKTKVDRMFMIVAQQGPYDPIQIYRKYVALRPTNIKHSRLFVYYKNGRCSDQCVGINTMAKIPKLIAEYLQLPEASLYTGHCFRRNSATLSKSPNASEDFIEDPISNKNMATHQIFMKLEEDCESSIVSSGSIPTTSGYR